MSLLRRAIIAGLVFLGALAAAYGVGSYDWCQRSASVPPKLQRAASAQGRLFAGVGVVELQPPYPVVKAGYAPLRPEATHAARPLHGRALVLQVGTVKVAIASLDLLLIPDSIASQVAGAVADIGFTEIWLAATHTHSSMGGFDPRPISEMAGTGRYQASGEQAVVRAAANALRAAASSLVPAEMQAGEGRFPGLVTARSEGPEPDGRLTRISIQSRGYPLAQVIIFSAHPTLLPRQSDALDPDYPGLFCEAEQRAGRGVTLFLQGAVGNASVALSAPDPWQREREFAAELSKATSQVALTPLAPVSLELRSVLASLPNPDASRSLPSPLWRVGRNFLCRSAPPQMEVSELKIASLSLLFVPGEPTVGSERRLLEASGAQRTVSLTNGYLGYIETPELVLQAKGESRRQYFGPELLEVLARAAQLAGNSFELTQGR